MDRHNDDDDNDDDDDDADIIGGWIIVRSEFLIPSRTKMEMEASKLRTILKSEYMLKAG